MTGEWELLKVVASRERARPVCEKPPARLGDVYFVNKSLVVKSVA